MRHRGIACWATQAINKLHGAMGFSGLETRMGLNGYIRVATASKTPKQFDSENPVERKHKFIETIEKNPSKYWKIGIHWLTALRSPILST